jgi:hypothetical protein
MLSGLGFFFSFSLEVMERADPRGSGWPRARSSIACSAPEVFLVSSRFLSPGPRLIGATSWIGSVKYGYGIVKCPSAWSGRGGGGPEFTRHLSGASLLD